VLFVRCIDFNSGLKMKSFLTLLLIYQSLGSTVGGHDVKPNEDIANLTIKLVQEVGRINGVVTSMQKSMKEQSERFERKIEKISVDFLATIARELKDIKENAKGQAEHVDKMIEDLVKSTDRKVEKLQSKMEVLDKSNSVLEWKMTMMSKMIDVKMNDVDKELGQRVKLSELNEAIEDEDVKIKEMKGKLDGTIKYVTSNLTRRVAENTLNLNTTTKRISQNIENLKQEQKHTDTETQKTTRELARKIKENNNNINSSGKQISMVRNEVEFQTLGLFNHLFPVGSLYLNFNGEEPPMQGYRGVVWIQLPSGYVLQTASKQDVGKRSGNQRLDGGQTNGHALSVKEMPAHKHDYTYFKVVGFHGAGKGSASVVQSTSNATTPQGGNQQHQHQLNIMNQKVMVWQRTS